jgi:hypothetical protein
MEHPAQPNAQYPPVDRRSRLWVIGRTVAHCLGFEGSALARLAPQPAAYAGGRTPAATTRRTSATATAASTSCSVKPGQGRGDSAATTAASHHVPRKQGTRPEAASNVRAPRGLVTVAERPPRPAMVATSSTSDGRDLLDQRWLRPPRPAVVATSSTSGGCGLLGQQPAAVGRTPAATTRPTSRPQPQRAPQAA